MSKTKQQKFTDSLRQNLLNTFSSGLNMDLHPLTAPNTVLTDCINGTTITYNDNEFVLQNDRGNSAILEAILPKGYLPISMKEYGGIIYIVSRNNEGKIEIGTYPSPKLSKSISSTYDVDDSNIWNKFKIANFKSGDSGKVFDYADFNYPVKYYWTDANSFIASPDSYKLTTPKYPNILKLEHFILSENGDLEKVDLISQNTNENVEHIFPNKYPGLLGYKISPLEILVTNVINNTINDGVINCTFEIQSEDAKLREMIEQKLGKIVFFTNYYFESDKNKISFLDFVKQIEHVNIKPDDSIRTDFSNYSYWNQIPANKIEYFGDRFKVTTDSLYFNTFFESIDYMKNTSPILPYLWLYDGKNNMDNASEILWDENNKILTIGGIKYNNFVIETIPVYMPGDNVNVEDNNIALILGESIKYSFDVGNIIHSPSWFTKFTYTSENTDNSEYINLTIKAELDLDHYFNSKDSQIDITSITTQSFEETEYQLFEYSENNNLNTHKNIINKTGFISTTSNGVKVLNGKTPIYTNGSDKTGRVFLQDNTLEINGAGFKIEGVRDVKNATFKLNGEFEIIYTNTDGEEVTSTHQPGVEVVDRKVKFEATYNDVKKDSIYIFKLTFPSFDTTSDNRETASFIVITSNYFFNLTDVDRFDRILLRDWIDKKKFNINLDIDRTVSEKISLISSNQSSNANNKLPLSYAHDDDSIEATVNTYLQNRKDVIDYSPNINLDEEIPHYKFSESYPLVFNHGAGVLNGLYQQTQFDINSIISFDVNGANVSKTFDYTKPYYDLKIPGFGRYKKYGYVLSDKSFGMNGKFYSNYDRKYLSEFTNYNSHESFEINAEHVGRIHDMGEDKSAIKFSTLDSWIMSKTGLWKCDREDWPDINKLQSGCGKLKTGIPKRCLISVENSKNELTFPLTYIKTLFSEFNFLTNGQLITGDRVSYINQEKDLLWGIGVNSEGVNFPISYTYNCTLDDLQEKIQSLTKHLYIKIPRQSHPIISMHYERNVSENKDYEIGAYCPNNIKISATFKMYPNQSNYIDKYIDTWNLQCTDNLNKNFAPEILVKDTIKLSDIKIELGENKYIDFLDKLLSKINKYHWTKEELYDSYFDNNPNTTLSPIVSDCNDVQNSTQGEGFIPDLKLGNLYYDWFHAHVCKLYGDSVENWPWHYIKSTNCEELEQMSWDVYGKEFPLPEDDWSMMESIKYSKLYGTQNNN